MSGSGSARATTAIEYAIGLVAARSWPEKKLHDKIAARYGADECESAMARMRELRLVNDEAWAERFARDRLERGGKGRHRIRGELLQRGIPGEIADAALARLLAGEDLEREKARRVLEQLRRRLGGGEAEETAADADSEAGRGDIGDGDTSDAEQRRESGGRPSPARRTRRPNAAQTLKNRLFRRMLARGYPASLVRDLLDVS